MYRAIWKTTENVEIVANRRTCHNQQSEAHVHEGCMMLHKTCMMLHSRSYVSTRDVSTRDRVPTGPYRVPNIFLKKYPDII